MSEAATVAEARSALGLEGDARKKQELPAWILLDLMLPDGSGIDILKEVHAERLESRVCIITGCGPEMLSEALRVGADYYVYFDCYTDHHYGALRTRDWKKWEDATKELVMPKGIRHGTAIEVDGKLIEHLIDALKGGLPEPIR